MSKKSASGSPGDGVSLARLICPPNRLDIVVKSDFDAGCSDVRVSHILDVKAGRLIAAQTQPPLLKSMTQSHFTVSTVYHDLIKSTYTRWGWTSQLQGLDNNYLLNPQQAEPAAVIFLSAPEQKDLTRLNIRNFYRLRVRSSHNIALIIKPEYAPVGLVDFSAGGLLLSTPSPSAYSLDQKVKLTLVFPKTEKYPEVTIQSEGEIVRQIDPHLPQIALLGVKYQPLKADVARLYQKVINDYMLEEQRTRSREG